MALFSTSCFKGVGATFVCEKCESLCIKYGKTKSGNQRLYCKKCKRTRVINYKYKAYCKSINANIVLLTKEGLGIRSTARVLGISTTTVLKRILSIAKSIPNPVISFGKTYEVDEMRTYIHNKTHLFWIVYALERETRKVVSFTVGKRTNKTLNFVLKSLSLSKAKTIYTDGLSNYKYLIPTAIHSVKRFATNHIERNNLNLRTHLKRLNRKTICATKSLIVLVAVLRIYFWDSLRDSKEHSQLITFHSLPLEIHF